VGGKLKHEPAAFVVVEVPLYEPSGEGPHVYLRLSREGWTTRDLAVRLAELFGLHPSEIGHAGLKDKVARVTQTVSLFLPDVEPDEVARRVEAELPVTVEAASRHRNKLKPGHLLGNRFELLLRRPGKDALARAERIAAALDEAGLPNYYGEQRLGAAGENPIKGRRMLQQGRRRKGWLSKLLLSAWQSELFNRWLAERLRRGWFDRLLLGDLARKQDTGGMFPVEDPAAEGPRLARHEISYTGPMYGWRMRWPDGEPRGLEEEVLAADGVTAEMLKAARLPGSRRPGRIRPEGLTIEPAPEGLRFVFGLPKGSYATSLLREFRKA